MKDMPCGHGRHLLDITDLTPAELDQVMAMAETGVGGLGRVLEGSGAALVFEKPSARTRSSTEMAVHHLGGHPVYIQGSEIGMDVRESVEDAARTLACYHAVICARVMDHRTLIRMASALDEASSAVPVVNLLSDVAHPCQAIADLLTVREAFGSAADRTLAFVGDANNVWRSLAWAGVYQGMALRIASPPGYGPPREDLEALERAGGDVTPLVDPEEAVAGADVIYTDVWTSMGQEVEAEARREAFRGYCVDEALVSKASPSAIVLHCLPAHRGEEISTAVIEGPASRVWRQAANRMPAALGVLAWLLEPSRASHGASGQRHESVPPGGGDVG